MTREAGMAAELSDFIKARAVAGKVPDMGLRT